MVGSAAELLLAWGRRWGGLRPGLPYPESRRELSPGLKHISVLVPKSLD